MKLNIKAFAITLGAVYGFILFFYTWWLILLGNLVGEAGFLGAIYPFYTVSPFGSLLGVVYGFIDGLIIGAIFAWSYNEIVDRQSTENTEEQGAAA